MDLCTAFFENREYRLTFVVICSVCVVYSSLPTCVVVYSPVRVVCSSMYQFEDLATTFRYITSFIFNTTKSPINLIEQRALYHIICRNTDQTIVEWGHVTATLCLLSALVQFRYYMGIITLKEHEPSTDTVVVLC